MRAMDFRACLDLLEIPNSRIAEKLGYSPSTVQKWTKDTSEIPPDVAKWIWKMAFCVAHFTVPKNPKSDDIEQNRFIRLSVHVLGSAPPQIRMEVKTNKWEMT